MSGGAWPYLPRQCPSCRYLHPIEPPAVVDGGYAIAGFCRHPLIGMELFLPRERAATEMERCRFFMPDPGAGGQTRGARAHRRCAYVGTLPLARSVPARSGPADTLAATSDEARWINRGGTADGLY